MMKINATLLLLLIPLAAIGDDKPAIRFPLVVQPAPIPPPVSPSKLTAQQLYCVDSDIPIIVLAAPKGLVTIKEEAGPIRVRGLFVDGTETETRLFKGKQVFIVEAAGVGNVDLLVIPQGATKESDVIRKCLQVDNGDPRPPPVPPGPNPPGPVPPIPDAGFRVLIVEETAELSKMPASQVQIRTSKTVRDYLDAKCAIGPDGKTREYRIWDKDVPAQNDPSVAMKAALARPRASIPWIIISNGKAGYEGALPLTVADTMTLLKKFGD